MIATDSSMRMSETAAVLVVQSLQSLAIILMMTAMATLMKVQPAVGKVKVAMKAYASMNVVMVAPRMTPSVLTTSAYRGVYSTLVR